MESAEMEIECDSTELGEIKESVSEHDASPSQDLDAIDPWNVNQQDQRLTRFLTKS